MIDEKAIPLKKDYALIMVALSDINDFEGKFDNGASRQQGKQQWAFYFDLSHDCSQTDISPLDSPPYRNQGVSFHLKTEDTSSSTWPSEFSYYSIMVISGNQ